MVMICSTRKIVVDYWYFLFAVSCHWSYHLDIILVFPIVSLSFLIQ